MPDTSPEDEPLTIEQWAEAASRTDARPELLNAFVAVQRAEGFTPRRAADWGALYSAFATRPVA